MKKALFLFCLFYFFTACGTTITQEQKYLEGLFYSSCNEYEVSKERIQFGLYPRFFLAFSPEKQSAKIFYSDQSVRHTTYEWVSDSLLKIDQYGQWTFSTHPLSIIWHNPFVENAPKACAYIPYRFAQENLPQALQKQIVDSLFQQKARELISQNIYVYRQDTLRFLADGRILGVEGLGYYEIDTQLENSDFDIVYFKETALPLAQYVDSSSVNAVGFVLKQEKLDFYLLESIYPPILGNFIISYESIEALEDDSDDETPTAPIEIEEELPKEDFEDDFEDDFEEELEDL